MTSSCSVRKWIHRYQRKSQVDDLSNIFEGCNAMYMVRKMLMLHCHSKFKDSNTFIRQNYIFSTWIDIIVLVLKQLLNLILFITVGIKFLIKERSHCHNDHHKEKKSNSPCNTRRISVFKHKAELSMCGSGLLTKLAKSFTTTLEPLASDHEISINAISGDSLLRWRKKKPCNNKITVN